MSVDEDPKIDIDKILAPGIIEWLLEACAFLVVAIIFLGLLYAVCKLVFAFGALFDLI